MNEILKGCTAFQWDDGNLLKNWEKHRVSATECEQAFFNLPFVVAEDPVHSQKEPRFFALGRTDLGRQLFLAFTVRGDKIRVISARDMSRLERKEYQHHEKEQDQEKEDPKARL